MDDALIGYDGSILLPAEGGVFQRCWSHVRSPPSPQRHFAGHVRFNANSGFNPEFLMRTIGRTFLCSGPTKIAGKVHLLFTRPVIEELPDAYLVTLNSVEHGAICFIEPGWRSSGVQPISISLRGSRFEAMLLMGAGDWVSGELGRWTIEATSNRLLLAQDSEGGSK